MNLKIKETLAKLLVLCTKTKTATISSGYTGLVTYVHIGKICVFSGYVVTSGALSHGQVLATGLPAYYNGYANPMVWATNNNSSSENVPIVIQQAGNLSVRGAFASSNRSLRFTGAYITSALGG